MSSSTILATSFMFGPVGWILAGGVLLAEGMRDRRAADSYTGENKDNDIRQQLAEAESLRQTRLQQQVDQAWQQVDLNLRHEIECLSSSEKERLLVSMISTEKKFRQSMLRGDSKSAEDAIASLRQDILNTKLDEKMLSDLNGTATQILSALNGKVPSAFISEFESIDKEAHETSALPLGEQIKRMKYIIGQLHDFSEQISLADSISISGLEEEMFFIPPSINKEGNASETEAALSMGLIHDICDFGGRIAFFSEWEAERLKPMIIEAKHGTDIPRLKLIRDQIKATYGRLREQAVMTDMFKQNIRDFLHPIQKAKDTGSLCSRMEDLLTASVISRDEYNEVYKIIKTTFTEQFETINDALFAEKIGQTLEEMGYTLMDEQGNPAELETGKIRMLSTPYEGYRVRVKVNKDNRLVTRLVRVVGSEEEKAAVSEYQRQKDVETGKKWCHDLDKFHKSLEDKGLAMDTVMRKEPEEEPLDIIVDKSVQTQYWSATTEQRQEKLQERKI